ncbi:MAG: endonuclease/exonuclease/phosphatase family protein [Eubacterium sp.]
MKHPIKTILKILGIILAVILLIVIIYVAYVFFSYHRIEDNQSLKINAPSEQSMNYDNSMVKTGTEYIIGTYNVGFGAYLPDYSFFMDGGTESRCYSKESAANTINDAAKLAISYKPDFMMFQEVDRNSTRSYHVNQEEMMNKVFSPYYESFAVNYDSAYLFYPFRKPIGKSYSGLSLYSKYEITDSIRRSLPISTGFSKFLDLDRCYSISRVNVENGKELVLFTVHLSAYGNSDKIRQGQLDMLFGDMKKEVDEGNYVVCGGDFNHDLKADESETENCESWAFPFPRSQMPEGLGFAMDKLSEDEIKDMPESSRNADMEYIPGKTYVVTLDGFIISDNIEMTEYEIKDTGYQYSDHQPVIMKFVLK